LGGRRLVRRHFIGFVASASLLHCRRFVFVAARFRVPASGAAPRHDPAVSRPLVFQCPPAKPKGWRALMRVPVGSPKKGRSHEAPAVAALGDRSAPDSWAGIGHDGLSACFSPVSPARQSKPPRGVAVPRRRALAHAPCLTLGPFRPDRGPVVVPAGGCRCLPTAWLRTMPAGATSGRCRMFPISATPKSLLRNWSPPVGAPSTSKDAMKIMRPATAGISG
jgi:hypothetical protein